MFWSIHDYRVLVEMHIGTALCSLASRTVIHFNYRCMPGDKNVAHTTLKIVEQRLNWYHNWRADQAFSIRGRNTSPRQSIPPWRRRLRVRKAYHSNTQERTPVITNYFLLTVWSSFSI